VAQYFKRFEQDCPQLPVLLAACLITTANKRRCSAADGCVNILLASLVNFMMLIASSRGPGVAFRMSWILRCSVSCSLRHAADNAHTLTSDALWGGCRGSAATGDAFAGGLRSPGVRPRTGPRSFGGDPRKVGSQPAHPPAVRQSPVHSAPGVRLRNYVAHNNIVRLW